MPQSPVTNSRFEETSGLILDRVTDLRAEISELKASQSVAIAVALREVLADKLIARIIVDHVAEAAQERATQVAGQGVWWVLRNVVARWVVIAAIVVMAAKVLGWDLATKVGKWLAGNT